MILSSLCGSGNGWRSEEKNLSKVEQDFFYFFETISNKSVVSDVIQELKSN